MIYGICHELTVEIKFIKRVLKNVIKRAFVERNNIFQNEFKFYHKSEQMSDSFYHITESSEMN